MKKYLFIIIILLIIIILTVSYSIYVYNIQNDEFINWLNTLISILISVLLALIIAILIFNYQTNLIQKETKDKFIPLIERELIDIWKDLSNLKYRTKIQFADSKELVFNLIIFHNIIFEQAICANIFNAEQTHFLLTVMEEVNFHNSVIEKFIDLYSRFIEEPDKCRKYLEFLNSNHNENITNLNITISSSNEYFKFNELNKEIKKNPLNTLE